MGVGRITPMYSNLATMTCVADVLFYLQQLSFWLVVVVIIPNVTKSIKMTVLLCNGTVQ